MTYKILHSKQKKEEDVTENDNKLGERYFHVNLDSILYLVSVSTVTNQTYMFYFIL